MKIIIPLLFLLLAASTFAAGQTELKFTANYTVPGDDETWDKALGAEAQVIFWISPEIGIAPSLGVGKWTAKEMYEEVYDPIYDVFVAAGIEGDATIVPIGVSLLVRPKLQGSVGLVFEGGLRYVSVSSNVEASALVTDGIDFVFLSDNIELGGGLIGSIVAELSFQAGAKTNIYTGLGYQFDISKGEATWFEEHLGENELKGLLIRAGVGFLF